jgi:hypothetical protein
MQRGIGPTGISTRKDFVDAAVDQIGGRRRAGKLLSSVRAVKEKRGVLEVLRAAPKAIVLQADAVQCRHLIPRIPCKCIGAIAEHIVVQVIADRDTVPVGQQGTSSIRRGGIHSIFGKLHLVLLLHKYEELCHGAFFER